MSAKLDLSYLCFMYSVDSDFILIWNGKTATELNNFETKEHILCLALVCTSPLQNNCQPTEQLYQLPLCLFPSYLGQHIFVALTFV